MTKRIVAALSMLLLVSAVSLGVPARKGAFTVVQPDGTSFKARLTGDEFMRILTTEDGCALAKDSEGFYQYAFYGSDGVKELSGYRPGSGNVPFLVTTESRNIPYEALRRKALERRREARSPVLSRKVLTRSGEKSTMRCLVLLVQFPDLAFQNPESRRADFIDQICTPGWSKGGASGSVKDYFNDQLGSLIDFQFDVSEIITVSRSYAYYGADDQETELDAHPDELALEACILADPEVDFSVYDNDGDGEVDNVFIIVAGLNQAEGADENYIWPHQWSIQQAKVLDGKRLGCYAMSTEMNISGYKANGQPVWGMAQIGTFCHEFSHTLGLVDLYDTDGEGSGGESEAMWFSTALMDGGSYNNGGRTPAGYNALDLELLGAGKPQKMTAGSWTLESIADTKSYLIFENPANEYEFFLFECRTQKGWDTHIGGGGLAIYHVDMTERLAGWSDSKEKEVTALYRWNTNEVNCNPDFQCADMVETVSDALDVRQAFFPYKGKTSFTVSTTPAFMFNDGTLSEYSISDISYSSGKVSFNVYDSNAVLPEVTNLRTEVYQDAVIVTWESDIPEWTDTCVISWGRTSKEMVSEKVTPYEPGKYSITLEGLSPATAYSLSVCFRSGLLSSEDAGADILTKALQSGKRPFIHLDYLYDSRTEDGKFLKGAGLPLRMFNAVGEKVVWEYDGRPASPDGSGYFHPSGSGTLKARIHHDNGAVEVISKEIILAK